MFTLLTCSTGFIEGHKEGEHGHLQDRGMHSCLVANGGRGTVEPLYTEEDLLNELHVHS